MNRLKQAFRTPSFVAYTMAGDGGLTYSLAMLHAMTRAGVDVLEIGVPFSDPVADGEVIQAAAGRALQQHINVQMVLQLIKDFRQDDQSTPIILFSYYNPIYNMCLQSNFLAKAREVGVDGVLIVDLPYEEAMEFTQQCAAHDIDFINLIAPSTPPARMMEIVRHAKGMIYYACRKGVTGVKNNLPEDICQRLVDIKALTDVPVVAGFGIGDKQAASQVLKYADGFVVGSRLVAAMGDHCNVTAMQALVKSIDPR